jgi:hypothetical protein
MFADLPMSGFPIMRVSLVDQANQMAVDLAERGRGIAAHLWETGKTCRSLVMLHGLL